MRFSFSFGFCWDNWKLPRIGFIFKGGRSDRSMWTYAAVGDKQSALTAMRDQLVDLTTKE